MAKLRVGDIQIDDDQIQIGGQHVAGGSTAVRSETRPFARSAASLAWIKSLPIPARWIGWSGAALSVLGFWLGSQAFDWDRPFQALASGGILVPIGAALIALGMAKRLVDQDAIDIDSIALGEDVEPLLRQLRETIPSADSHQTLEWIQRRTGLPESTVVKLLSILRDRGELFEELDPDNAEFYYRAIRPDPQDLDARLATINKRRKL